VRGCGRGEVELVICWRLGSSCCLGAGKHLSANMFFGVKVTDMMACFLYCFLLMGCGLGEWWSNFGTGGGRPRRLCVC